MKTRAKDINEKITWQELTTGVEIYEPATSLLVETGDWRVDVPVFKEDKCKQCLLCVPFCPDSSIPVKDGKRLDFDFKHCKGSYFHPAGSPLLPGVAAAAVPGIHHRDSKSTADFLRWRFGAVSYRSRSCPDSAAV